MSEIIQLPGVDLRPPEEEEEKVLPLSEEGEVINLGSEPIDLRIPDQDGLIAGDVQEGFIPLELADEEQFEDVPTNIDTEISREDTMADDVILDEIANGKDIQQSKTFQKATVTQEKLRKGNEIIQHSLAHLGMDYDGFSYVLGSEALGALETIGLPIFHLASEAIAMPQAAAETIANEFLPPVWDEYEDKNWHERVLSVKAKIQAEEGGVANFLSIDAFTEQGNRNLTKLGEWWHIAKDNTSGAAARAYAGGIEDIQDLVIEQREKDLGRPLTNPEALDYIAAGTSNPALPIIQTAIETSPDALLFLYPTLSSMSRSRLRTKYLEETKVRAEAYDIFSEQRSVSIGKLDQMIPNAELLPAARAEMLEAMKRGEQFPDIVVETVNGSPTGNIAGWENVLFMKEWAKAHGVKLKNVKVRFLEKNTFTEAEVAVMRKTGNDVFTRVRENNARLKEMNKGKKKDWWSDFKTKFIDASANIKKDLFKDYGTLGTDAVMKLELIAGATAKAQMRYQDVSGLVWGKRGVNDARISYDSSIKWLDNEGKTTMVSEMELLDMYMHARRTQEVVKLTKKKGKGEKPQNFAGPIKTVEDASGVISRIGEILPKERILQFETRTQILFDEMKVMLGEMLDAGLITKETYGNMKDMHYISREFANDIDPVFHYKGKSGKAISVGDSGIVPMSYGKTDRLQRLSVEDVTAEYIARLERRMAKNKANLALLDVIDSTEGGIGWAMRGMTTKSGKAKPVPEGWQEIQVMKNGQPERMWMKDNKADEWIINDPGQAAAELGWIRVATGSAFVKPLATGFNPGFAVRNLPRDMVHAWRAGGDTYSTLAPMAFGEMMIDMIQVAPDAIFKRGRYKDYINEGGGLPLLAHQGREVFLGEAGALAQVRGGRGKWGHRYQTLKEAAGSINEFSEIWVRLAIRETVMKKQQIRGEPINSQVATWTARRYLDFAQGGTITKNLEAFFPYLNSTTQAFRTSFREYGRGNKAAMNMLAKDLQLVGAKSFAQSRFWEEQPDVMRQIPRHIRMNNFVVPTGMTRIDEKGNTRHGFFNIAMDGTVTPFTYATDLLLEKHYTGTIAEDDYFKAIQEALVKYDILPEKPQGRMEFGEDSNLEALIEATNMYANLGVPAYQLLSVIAYGRDSFFSDDVWKGDPNVSMGEQFDPLTQSDTAIMLGEAFPNTVSPARVDAAFRALPFRSNTFFFSGSQMADMYKRSQDPDKFSADYEEFNSAASQFWNNTAIARRAVSWTHPAAIMTEVEEQALQHLADRAKHYNDQLQRIVQAERQNPARVEEEIQKLERIIEKENPGKAQDLLPDLLKQIAVENTYNSLNLKETFMSKGYWIKIANQPTEERAAVFHFIYRTRDQKGRDKMIKAAKSMSVQPGMKDFLSNDFIAEFGRLIAEDGDLLPISFDE